MKKQKDAELSRMFAYAGNYHGLTVLGCILAAVSTVLSMLPFVCIWFVIRDLIHAGGQTGAAQTGGAHYAWLAVLFSVLSILLYFLIIHNIVKIIFTSKRITVLYTSRYKLAKKPGNNCMYFFPQEYISFHLQSNIYHAFYPSFSTVSTDWPYYIV